LQASAPAVIRWANVLQSGYLCRRPIMVSRLIIRLLDFFYPLFSRLMPRQTFYYAACGGTNTLFGIFVFFVSFHYLVKKQIIHLPIIAISPHIAAMIISFVCTFLVGFFLANTVVFSGSVLRRRHQLARYFLTSLVSLLLNYVNLKIFVDALHIFPTIAQVLNAVVVVSFSFAAQKYFAFKAHPPKISG
jgi:putative flippase GtrA